MTTQRIIKIDGKDVLCRELCASEIRQAGDVWGDGRRCIISWGLAVAVGEERAGELWRPAEPAPTPEPASDPDGNYMLERALKAEFRVRELESAIKQAYDCAQMQRLGFCAERQRIEQLEAANSQHRSSPVTGASPPS